MHHTADKSRAFCDVFYEVTMDENLMEVFRESWVSRLQYKKVPGWMEINLEIPYLVETRQIEKLENSLSQFFKMGVKVSPHFQIEQDNEQLIKICRAEMLRIVSNKSKHYGCLLEDARFSIEGQTLKIFLNTTGSMILQSGKCHKILEDFFKAGFHRNISVKFIDPTLDEKERENYYKAKVSQETETVQNIIRYPVRAEQREDMKVSGSQNAYRNRKKATNQSTHSDMVYGKAFSEEILPMNEVTIDSGRVAVKGKVIRLDTRLLKSKKTLFIFDITDLTHTLTVKCFANEKQLGSLKENVRIGKWFCVYGDTQFDTFSKDLTMMARGIVKTSVAKRLDQASVKRVELHAHTQMSQMDAVTSVKEFVERAAEWEHPAVAITDHGVVQAFPDACAAAEKAGIKLIYGVEIYLLKEDAVTPDGKIDYKNTDTSHTIILVKNGTGLKNLYHIISESHMNYFYKKPRVPRALLEKYREGLILGSACEAGEVYQAILQGKEEEELIRIAGEYDYLEIQPLHNNRFLIESGQVTGYDELKAHNQKIIELARKLHKPVAATCDVHFLDPSDEIFRRILQAGQGYSDADNQAPLFFRTTEEMLEEFSYLGEEIAYEVVVTNTRLISDWIEEVHPIPNGTFPPYIAGAEEDIKRLSTQRAESLYGSPLPEQVRIRMDKELESIIKNGFSVMYMIAQKLVSKSLEDGYLVGSRGSVGSSFVAYLTGITEVNSLPAHYRCGKCLYSEFFEMASAVGCGFDLEDKKCPKCGEELIKDGYDIPFETFLGFDGDKEPDIDLNFSGEYQPQAHKYTEDLFGEGHVFRAGTIATVADKTAFGFVKGYLNDREKRATNAEINRLVSGCTGIKRTTGQHPGGVMIVPHDREIFDFCPVQRPADDPGSNIITTHFDYHSISGRILKLDILGHDDPTVIRMLQDITGIDPQQIPIGEKRTMEIFRNTKPLGIAPEDINSEVGTFGIPEFGTRFVRQMLMDTKPTTFAELIRISGLSHGTDVWTNNAQELVRKGIAALPNVISTRDDIMIFLMKSRMEPLTSFKIMEDVRKGKGLTPDYEKQMREAGVPDWYIESCKKIKYMFPKAHAAAYVMMAFRIAWFKVYYPEAFYATYFTVRADEFDADIISRGRDKIQYSMKELEKKGNDMTQKEKNMLTILEVANEMYARGFKCLPVDLYCSDATQFQIYEKGILPPLNALQGLGTMAAKKIAEAREAGPFISIDDMKNRTGISKSVVEIMESHGCLKGMEQSNQVSFL